MSTTRALAWAALALLVALPSVAIADGDPRRAVTAAMKAELARAMASLRLPGYEPPYFIAYVVRDHESVEVSGKAGALFTDRGEHRRRAYVEVRVGDYALDNTGTAFEGGLGLDEPDAFDPDTTAPLDDAPDALRATLWLLTDTRYKQALAAYARKRGRRATQVVEDETLASFAREPAAQAIEPPQPIVLDRGLAAAQVRRVSARFTQRPAVFEAEVRIAAQRVVRHLVTSEGSELISESTIYSAIVWGAARAPDGMLIEHEKAFYGASLAELPDEAGLLRAADELATELGALREAKPIDPYSGPAILLPQAAGVFFHETVGHRLEGERQNDENEGRTFKGQIGQRILPPFLSVVDDPTRRTIRVADAAEGRADGGAARPGDEHEVSLNGYYRHDDEGVAARPVVLIKDGVLRDYLMSRTPIKGSVRSNGHGRAAGTSDPMGRMANLVVRSTRRVPLAELKRRLIEETRRQGKPYGLIIRDIAGGSTNTANYGFQAFKGQARLVYRVDARTGAETLVRGVEMVGTPLSSIAKIVATSDHDGVFNGYCGAESGMVPVSTVAPAVLMTEIELQRSQRVLERALILPPPWAAPSPATVAPTTVPGVKTIPAPR